MHDPTSFTGRERGAILTQEGAPRNAAWRPTEAVINLGTTPWGSALRSPQPHERREVHYPARDLSLSLSLSSPDTSTYTFACKYIRKCQTTILTRTLKTELTENLPETT